VRGAVSVDLTATRAFVNDYVALFGVGYYLDWLHGRAAFAGAVTGIDVDVERPKAKGAVIARRISKRLYFTSAVGAHKSRVIF